jgi:hypothetical protein
MSGATAPRFLPWLRTGLATEITALAERGLAKADTTSIAVSLTLRATGAQEHVEPVASPAVRLRGPGDVTGLDRSLVVRRDPEDGVTDAENTYLALVEFSAPDLPWRFTPAAHDADDRLQPWIALVVVELRDGVWLETGSGTRLPILHVDDQSRELWDETQCWAWAHVHAEHDLAGGIATALSEAPEAFRSRLLCPRRLRRDRSWLACVVPTFAAGKNAGLGKPVTAGMGLAWSHASTEPIDLPVYYSWRFRTGPGGDFESLVRRLEARTLPGTVGRRDLDISAPGGDLPVVKGAVITYQGALVSPSGRGHPWPEREREAMKTALRDAVNTAAVRRDVPATYDALRNDPVVGPPAYGATQAGRQRGLVPPDGIPPLWLGELNTEPHHRSVAGVAADVIRRDQEPLMAAAWEYAAGAREASRLLTRARAAGEGAKKLRRRLDKLSNETFVQLAGPALARLRPPAGGTLAGALARSALPAGLLSGAFRRLSHTVLARGSANRAPLADAIVAVALDDAVSFAAAWADVLPPAGADVGGAHDEDLERVVRGPVLTTAGARSVRARAAEQRTYVLAAPLVQAWATHRYTGDPAPVETLAADARAALDPLATIAAMVSSRITGVSARAGEDVPDRVFVHPTFDTPMYRRLAALSVEYLVPGIGEVPADTLGLLETNPPFVEAFMAGLNHEMGREFLWREYPAQLDDTWFRHFWDGGAGRPADIEPIHDWKDDAGLGANRPKRGEAASLVLLVKSALLRRYPDVRIYAAEAMWEKGTRREAVGGVLEVPVFQARLGPDVTALGFALTAETARGSRTPGSRRPPQHPGYFFVLEQPPGAPRFGLDAARPARAGRAPQSWANLSWSHLAEKDAPLPDFVDVEGPSWLVDAGALPGNGGTGPGSRDRWGADAAAMARITFQRPVRVLVHADSMLPARVTGKGDDTKSGRSPGARGDRPNGA